MALEGMRGPYGRLRKRLERAGYQYVLGAGAEPQVELYENFKTRRILYLVNKRKFPDARHYIILKDWPKWVSRYGS